MKTLSGIKLKIMVRAFRIRIKNGEAFEDIAADYPALTTDDLEAIKEALNTNQQEQRLWRTMQNAIWKSLPVEEMHFEPRSWHYSWEINHWQIFLSAV